MCTVNVNYNINADIMHIIFNKYYLNNIIFQIGFKFDNILIIDVL